ncbi:MAG: MucR family transcriptional regulator [Desulfobaccales bacterium]
MSSEILNLTAQIVISHASLTELTPKELVAEIKAIHAALVSLDQEVDVEVSESIPRVKRQYKPRKVKMKESPEAKAVENEEGLPVGDPDYQEFMESREG